jgi:hypothetical protein
MSSPLIENFHQSTAWGRVLRSQTKAKCFINEEWLQIWRTNNYWSCLRVLRQANTILSKQILPFIRLRFLDFGYSYKSILSCGRCVATVYETTDRINHLIRPGTARRPHFQHAVLVCFTLHTPYYVLFISQGGRPTQRDYSVCPAGCRK